MDTLKANQIIHGQLAKIGEYDKSPHFLPENIIFVKSLINDFAEKISPKNLCLFDSCLDLGCGTGFMYEILKDYPPKSYIGIDITQEMLDVFQQKYPNANFLIAQAEDVPFENSTFSLVTNYSFLDHLDDLSVVFSETYRVLRPGGVFYSGLIPNASFSNVVSDACDSSSGYMWFDSQDYLEKEYKSMHNNGKVYADQYGFSADILAQAEPQKTNNTGIDINEIYALLKDQGFSQILICPNWFFGQAKYKIKPSEMHAIDRYLKSIGPVGQSLFKYFDFFAIK